MPAINSAAVLFEEWPGIFEFQGAIAPIQTVETPSANLTDASNIIRTDLPFDINFDWTQEGALVAWGPGRWRGDAFLEEMGQGEYLGPPLNFNIPHVLANPHNYVQTINVPANTVQPGIYRLVVRLAFEFEFPAGVFHPGPVAAFAEFGLVQFYESIIP